MTIRVRFFTLPPYTIPWPYILINANNPRPGLRYIKKHKEGIAMVIIDSGVEIFRDPLVKEYPRDHEHKIHQLYLEVRHYVKNVLVVVPDYPDDYHPKSLWLNNVITNIERTWLNVIKYTHKYWDIRWMIPIQGHYRDPKSIIRAIELYEESGILRRFKYFAVANLCTERKPDIIVKTLKLAREYLPDKYIHAFGINLRSIKHVYKYIDSFDSMAWTRPVSKKKLKANWSAKNLKEREKFFRAWIARLNELIDEE